MEIEVKRVISSPSGFQCDFCPEAAKRVVKIGEVQYNAGSYFDLCEQPECEEKAMEAYQKGDIDRGE